MNHRGKALVVEDNIALARITQFGLERAGFDVRVASNGKRALELVRGETFDVIISDQQMPEMTGIEFCRRMRGMPEYAKTPIILLTAKGLELDLESIRADLGINAVFAKPFSPSGVVEAACQFVEASLVAQTSPP